MRALWCLGLLSCSSAGLPGPSPGQSSQASRSAQPPFQPGIELSDSIQSLDSGVTSTRFNFSHLGVLWVRLKLPGMSRVSTVQLRVISPSGNLRYEADIPFSPEHDVTTVVLPDVAHPIAVQRAKPAGGGYHLDYPIAIAGTSFTKYPEPGGWQVLAQVEETRQTFSTAMDVAVAQ
jgi:hypothetical protein